MLASSAIAFWLLGLCNNFAYVIMLSAAKDVLDLHGVHPSSAPSLACSEKITKRECSQISTGSILLADIIPSLIIKVSAPLYIHRIPFGVRHFIVVILQATSFLTVALSQSTTVAVLGVVLASAGSGLGEVSLLSLSSFFPPGVLTAWSSGTGGAGVVGAAVYAVLTDARLAALSPGHALLSMLVVPLLFVYAFWGILTLPPTVHRVKVLQPSTYIVPFSERTSSVTDDLSSSSSESDDSPLLHRDRQVRSIRINFGALPWSDKLSVIQPLLRYMIPLSAVYFGEYFINQGLLELFQFDCANSFWLDPAAQYRWMQLHYQVGVMISRTLAPSLRSPPSPSLVASLQLLNALFLTWCAWNGRLLPHLLLLLSIVFYEGLLGGTAYVCTFRAIHREVSDDRREFSLGFVSIADSLGILAAGFLAIPTHNLICTLPLDPL